jgi:hypothetical protein
VTTVKIFEIGRPSPQPAVCAQVLDVRGSLAAAASAHAIAVGLAAVPSVSGIGALQIQAQWTQLQGRGVRAYGANGFKASGNTMVVRAVDVVGGVPPRGRPV